MKFVRCPRAPTVVAAVDGELKAAPEGSPLTGLGCADDGEPR